jgi:hypothetical protein
MAAGATSAPPKPAPTGGSTISEKEDAKNKSTYRITVKDLEEMESKATAMDEERPLRHHWTNFSFYLMASLSVVLPLLFLRKSNSYFMDRNLVWVDDLSNKMIIVLAVFIFLMKGKSVENSGYRVMPDVIKAGISAWPIVFAAVVAQVFKAYATWRVERGIKLIQLEQLIGSNSFGSAIKQPMVLRQIDVLSMLLLLTWCLSPFGSQALQRTYDTELSVVKDNVTIHYVDQTQKNKVFDKDWEKLTNDTLHAADNQMVAIFFLMSVAPVDNSKSDTWYMDQYNNPRLYKPDIYYDSEDHPVEAISAFPISGMGLPMVLPDPKIGGEISYSDEKGTESEEMTFNVTSSYFEFECGNWSTKSRKALSVEYPAVNLTWSSSNTLGLQFPGNSDTINQVSFASANIDPEATALNSTWDYSFIQCDFHQRFIDSEIYCIWLPPSEKSGKYDLQTTCYQNRVNWTSNATVTEKKMDTPLEDFSDDWALMGSPRNGNTAGNSTTPSKYSPSCSVASVGLGF